MPHDTDLYDYHLPEDRIAQEPLPDRNASRLLVLDRNKNSIGDRTFRDLPEYLREGDLLVVNVSKVFPARLFVNKETGAKIELLFLEQSGPDPARWKALARPGRRLKEDTKLFHETAENAFCIVREKLERGMWIVETPGGGVIPFLEKHGTTPLPPYIKKGIENPDRYQTVYAETTGSTAAPTAGMHFTHELIEKIKSMGVNFADVTLHIGIDTFRPITAGTLEEHEMHTEFFSVSEETAAALCRTAASGGRIIAVGTTVVRSLESWAGGRAREQWMQAPKGRSGATDIFIYRNSQFKIVDAMITNFHLPRSTLLALVSAFAGREFILESYKRAIELDYRFYSFGDAMLII